MSKNSDYIIPVTQSPSITQETKARFNELLSAALSRDASDESKLLETPRSFHPKSQSNQSQFIPKAVPRKKLIKSPGVDNQRNNENNRSSEESSTTSRTVSRQVIAEVHNSRTKLLLSSSDEDILSEKKVNTKRKKSKWKQAAKIAQTFTTEGQENKTFVDDHLDNDNSPSRLSTRSYTVETPTIPVHNLKLVDSVSHVRDRIKDYSSNNSSPSRLSNQSYTIETPNILETPNSKDQYVQPTIKTPVPLPRRKSLNLTPGPGLENDDLKGLTLPEDISNYESDIGMEHKPGQVATVMSHLEGDSNISDRAAVRLQESVEHTEDDGDMPLAVRKQKRKKKRRKHSKSRDQIELQEFTPKSHHVDVGSVEESTMHSTIKGSLNSDIETGDLCEQLLGVTVHGVDCLLTDPLVQHPMVRLSIVDTISGEYFGKSERSRSVCYFEENTRYIPPIMTHPFDFKQHKSMQPQWEECLLLNENTSHLLTQHTLLLFELCDFLPMALAGSDTRHRKLGGMAGWHLVAWAFLRPGTLGLGAKLQLQLYKPGKYPKSLRTCTPVVYEWWGSAARHKYPGCLYVTLSAIDPPTVPPSPRLRSRTALQSERGSESSARSASASVAVSETNSDDNHGKERRTREEKVEWSRMPAQSCKIPNNRSATLPVDGCMCLEFSSCGRLLACARQEVLVFSVPELQPVATLSGHQGLVYCLRWSSDSKILLSASADCTICVWRPHHHRMPLLQMLAHPSFVYCAHFIPCRGLLTVVSGCYDGLLKLWQGETHSSYKVTQEVCGAASNGYVTALCVTVDGATVVAADSQGSVRVYEVDDDGSECGQCCNLIDVISLVSGRELKVREVRGKIISHILAHPGGHRLIIHTRDNLVRSVDIATGAIIQIFKGLKNEHVQTGACVSPCGSLVFACGEDGSVMVWDGHTGSVRAIYCHFLPPGSAAVHYHPHEHLLAVGSLTQAPVHILTFNRAASGEEIGLTFVDNESSAGKIINTVKASDEWLNSVPKVTSSSSQQSISLQGRDEKQNRDEKQKHSSQEFISFKWPSLPKVDHSKDAEVSEDKDLRLLEIIKKMDSIIFAAKQSSQS